MIKKIICPVCGETIYFKNNNCVKCGGCGYNLFIDSMDYPNAANPPNFISLNRAIENYQNNRSFYPTYEEFIDLLSRGLDMSFTYDGKRFFVLKHEDFELLDENERVIEEYKDNLDIKENFSIKGEKLKDNFYKIKNLKYEV